MVATQHRGGALGAPARDARDAVGVVADERQPIGNGGRLDAELVHHTVAVEDLAAHAVAAHDAILEAGRARLRPILMTTATTVLGLLPLTGWLAGVPVLGEFGAGEGAEMRAPMAITVIAGLVSSTLLTLVVIPVIYGLVSGGLGTSRSLTPEAPDEGGVPA